MLPCLLDYQLTEDGQALATLGPGLTSYSLGALTGTHVFGLTAVGKGPQGQAATSPTATTTIVAGVTANVVRLHLQGETP